MRRIEALVAVAAGACLCAALAGCAAQEPAAHKESPAPQATSEPHPDFMEAKPVEAPLREGKDEITVLVLNASGEEGAARKAAEDIEALGFEHVTADNATSHQMGNRVSYHHEEHRAEVDEVAALFDSLPPYDPYCYEDAWSGGWSMDYDILVMVGKS